MLSHRISSVAHTLIVFFALTLICSHASAQDARRNVGDLAATGPWKQLAKLTEAKGKTQDWLGWSVAVSKDGNTVAVGAVGWCPTQNFGCGQGAIFVFVKPPNGWADMTETARLLASDGQPGDYLGESVAISDDGSAIVAGAPEWPANGKSNGALYLFLKPRSGWKNAAETARLTSTDGAGVDLGDSVAIGGNTIAGGGKYFNGLQGAAYVFEKPQLGWKNMTQKARLTPSDGKGGFMGWSISLQADTVVVGAPITGTGGAGDGAYVFVKPKSGWKNGTETAKLTASRGVGFRLGQSVSISGDTIALGSPYRGNDNGAIYVYVKPTHGWRSITEIARLTVPPQFNLLGFSVSVDRDEKRIVGGAPGWQGRGAMDLFTEPMSGWKTTSKAQARLSAADGRSMDALGYSISTSPTAIVAGAPNAAIGVNREEGAAYVFGR
jgi:hypothetical protein